MQCASLSLCHFCLSLILALYQRRVRLCCRQEEAQEEHRRRETVGREGEGRHGWSAIRVADGAKGHVVSKYRK